MFMRVKYTSVFYIKKFFGVMNSYFLDTQNWKIGFLLKKMSCAFLFFFFSHSCLPTVEPACAVPSLNASSFTRRSILYPITFATLLYNIYFTSVMLATKSLIKRYTVFSRV